MNDIKVGEYVRLARNQGINKIFDEDEWRFELEDEICNEWGELGNTIEKSDAEKEVLKHSFNIIDLIEVEDYVNGYKVDEVRNNYYVFCDNYNIEYQEYQIKDVVTKEQFNSIKYVLGE